MEHIHIEMVGMPGAGKTSIFNGLIRDDDVYSPKMEYATNRLLHEHQSFLGNISTKIPDEILYRVSNQLVKARYQPGALLEFFDNHPGYLSLMDNSREMVKYDEDIIIPAFWKVAYRYQLGVDTAESSEAITFDEGFCQKASSVLWRARAKEFEFGYWDTIPLPECVVYVDAPVETCLKRQRNRNNIVVDKEWGDDFQTEQEFLNSVFTQITSTLSDYGVEIIHIENTGSLSNSISEVKERLDSL